MDVDKNKITYMQIIFIFLFFVLSVVWMIVIPFNDAPDEAMRYDIAKYIFNYCKLPHGGDPIIRNEIWGISYGFTPILSYMISAVFMWIGSIFNNSSNYLYLYARFASVIFSTGTIFVCMKISNLLFKNNLKWLFVIFVAFLPQFQFISSYVNCDALAIFSVSLIIYYTIIGHRDIWSLKTCIKLGLSIGICLLSYYNTYGVILVTVVYCICDVACNKEIENKLIFISKRFLWVSLSTILVAGWWFIRNYVIYNGDVLGLTTSAKYAEKYAIDIYKPSNRITPYNSGVSLKYMLVDMKWIESSYQSYIGAFSWMSIMLPMWVYNIYTGFLSIFSIGCINRMIKLIKDKKLFNGFDIAMFFMCIFSIMISIYYSYMNDFQAQGRYCFAMLIPFAILLVKGINQFMDLLNIRKDYIINIFILILIMCGIYSFFGVLAVYY